MSFVALHTAPQRVASSNALVRSLDEISSWDWAGAELVVEHCDAAIPGQDFEKGFLRLNDELDAIDRSNAPVGLWLNWGRSAIELRNADAVTDQLVTGAQSGRLAGLTLSGAAAVDGPYGPAWADAHLPLLSADPASRSLLDDEHLRTAVIAVADAPWLGLKVSRMPGDVTAEQVLRTVARNLALVQQPIGGLPAA